MTQREIGGTTDGSEWWSGFEHDPRTVSHRGLRAADRDRDHVLSLLTQGFADGRLDRAEFDERADAVTAARTRGELTPVVSDLVLVDTPRASDGRLLPAGVLQEKAVAKWRADRREAVWTMVMASTICWVIWAATSGFGFPWPLFVMLGTGLNLARVQFLRANQIEEEKARLERKQAKQLRRRQDEESA